MNRGFASDCIRREYIVREDMSVESYFYFGSAGLVLLQIYLSLRKRWYIGTVLPVIMLIVPLAASMAILRANFYQ